MFKKSSILVFTTLAFFSFVLYPLAVTIPNPLQESLPQFLSRAFSLLRIVFVLMLLSVVLWSGTTMLWSGEDKGQKTKAWQTLLGALIGALIILLAPSAVQLVANLTGTDLIVF